MIRDAIWALRREGVAAATREVRRSLGQQPIARLYRYWMEHGAEATVHRAAATVLEATSPVGPSAPVSPQLLLRRRFGGLGRLPVRAVSGARRRINVVTDTINPPHLFGGVATALILAVLLAERTGSELRIITTMARPNPENFDLVIRAAELGSAPSPQFAFVGSGPVRSFIEAGPDELFLTTSWWTTRSTSLTVPPERIVYLLQEDERMFYPLGDEHLRCAEMLADPRITVVVNTKRLFDHLVESGLGNLRHRGTWFEPAFPIGTFHPPTAPPERPPHRFLFYARPNNLRNLFLRGVEAVDRAVDAGVLDPSTWQIHFVGKDIPELVLARNVRPTIYENLSWPAYGALVRTMDLGLSLMYTPHPSYPPLDLAASGAVAVTNSFGPKQDLTAYSRNILCAGSTVEELVEALDRGARLALDRETRLANYHSSGLLRDWRVSLASAIDYIGSSHFAQSSVIAQ